MAMITYMLGAGASFNALPLVYEIPLHLRLMAEYIQNHHSGDQTISYVNDINELSNELSDYNTIDNYARVLFQNKTSTQLGKLRKLKSLLCGLFLFEQLKKKYQIINKYANVNGSEVSRISRTLDPRYSSFFAKVLNDDKLSDQINIISWNYDLQLEIGLENNLGYSYDSLTTACQIFPHPSYIFKKERPSFIRNVHTGGSQIIKINGSAGLFLGENKFRHIYGGQATFFDNELTTLLKIHSESSRQEVYNQFLQFAWEKNENTELAVQLASRVISNTDVLIVIGYSFPDFNRSIDKQIFQDYSRIKEIFVQVPHEAFDTVTYSMKSSIGNAITKCVNINKLNDFFIPHQFIPPY